MALEVLAEPTVEVSGETSTVGNLLATNLMVTSELGSEPPFDNAAFVTQLIQEASDYVESYVGRSLGQRIYKQTLGSRGAPRLVVGHFPLSAIGYIQERRGLAGNIVYNKLKTSQYEIEDEKAGFIYAREGFVSTHRYYQYITAHPTRFLDPDWEVKYRAGYVLAGADSSYTLTDPNPESGDTGMDLSITADDTDKGPKIPADLQRATIQIVKVWGLTLENDPSVVQEKVGDASETRWNTRTGFGPTVTGVLDRYRAFMFDGC